MYIITRTINKAQCETLKLLKSPHLHQQHPTPHLSVQVSCAKYINYIKNDLILLFSGTVYFWCFFFNQEQQLYLENLKVISKWKN